MKRTMASFTKTGVLLLALWMLPSLLFAAEVQSSKQLVRRGTKLWGYYCAYCHSPIPGADYNRVQWETLMLHMRVRAYLTADDSRAILAYLRSTH